MRFLLASFFVLLFSPQLPAQHYLTVGVGYTTVFFLSDDLDQLRDTYNYVNRDNMNRLLVGFQSADGVRVESGYRYLEKWSAAFTLGYERYSTFDAASYNNGEGRQLDLMIDYFLLDTEFGVHRNNYFFDGLLRLSFLRNLELKSQYTGNTEDIERYFTGTFTSDAHFSLGFGISLGAHKEPFMLIGKMLYPVYTLEANKDLLARDATGNRRFPTDFINFHNALPYDALSNGDLDGLQIILSFVVALAI